MGQRCANAPRSVAPQQRRHVQPAVNVPDDDVAALDERVVITSAARPAAAVAVVAGTAAHLGVGFCYLLTGLVAPILWWVVPIL